MLAAAAAPSAAKVKPLTYGATVVSNDPFYVDKTVSVRLHPPTQTGILHGWVVGPPTAVDKRCGTPKHRTDIRMERLQGGVVTKSYAPVSTSNGAATFEGEPSPPILGPGGEDLGSGPKTWDPASTYRVVVDKRVLRGLYLQRARHGKVSKKYEKAPTITCPASTLELGSPGAQPVVGP